MATMIIEGDRSAAATGRTYEIRNPATGEVVDAVPDGGPEDLDQAAQAAARAQRDWGRRSSVERREILHRAAAHMLTKVAEFYEDQVAAAMKALTSILEPLMIIIVGGIVGFIVIAMYLPMFKVYDQIK